MTRISTKIGDIFSIKVDESYKKFFQLICFDQLQLNSDVIRIFKKKYSNNINPNNSEIIDGEVDFYAHCITKLGIKMNIWEKVGNIKDVGDINNILFKNTDDYGSKIGERQTKVSNNWYVWRINDKSFTKVGKLKGLNKNAEIGLIINPNDIANRVKKGKYDFIYPDYE